MTEMTTITKTKLFTPIAIIVGGFAMLVVAAGFLLLRTPAEPTLTELTKQTITASDQYRSAPSKSKTAKRTNLIKVAEKRLNKLRALITTNPDQVLAAAIPQTILANIPPELQAYTEKYVTAKGSYGIITSDDFEKQTSKDWQVFNSEDGRSMYYLYPTGKLEIPPIGVNNITGTVSGVLIGSNLALTPQAAIIDASTAQAETNAAVTGPQNTLVVKVNYSDYSTTTPTTATLRNVFFDRTGTTRETGSLNSYYQEVSYNKISVTGNVIGPYTINVPRSSDCNFSDVWQATIDAVDPDVDFTQYQHLVVVAPFDNCSYAGIATVGRNNIATADGYVSISRTLTQPDFHVATHEFGHQLGNHHAQFLDCGSASFGSDGWSAGCSTLEYGDWANVMGHSSIMGHFNAGHKNYLGWLSSTNIINLTSTSDLGSSCVQEGVLVNNVRTVICTIEPIETCLTGIPCRPGDPAPTGLKAIRLNRANSDYFLSIEYRQPYGFDAILGSNALSTNLTAGGLVHLNNSGGFLTQFIDTTTSTINPQWQITPAFLPDQTLTDPVTGAIIKIVSVTPSALTVRITTGKQDFTLPTISFDSVPSELSYVDKSIDIVAQASDPTGISKVEFYANSSTMPFTTFTTPPYTAHLDTSSYAEGSLSITAKAYDAAGQFWNLNNMNSAIKNYTVMHGFKVVTVLKGTTPVTGARVIVQNDQNPPSILGNVVTDVNGQAKLPIVEGTNVKYTVKYGINYGICQSIETGYAVILPNKTLQLPEASTISFLDATGKPISGLPVQVIDQNNMGICVAVKTGDPLYIQPGLSVKFGFWNATLGKNIYTSYYSTPVQAKLCVDAAGLERTCPADSDGSPGKVIEPIDSGTGAN